SWARFVREWIITVDHKHLGLMYIIIALLFFVVAGLQAAMIRIQLMVPNSHFVSPQSFNRMFTMHGTTMVFFVGMPFIAGIANYLIPLMLGARDMAFPRLNALGFWLTLFGGILLYSSYLAWSGAAGTGTAPDVGWFAYAPLTEKAFSPGTSTDFWILSIIMSSTGSTITAINILGTALCLRTTGMTLARMPLLVWMYCVVSFQILVALPPLTAAQIMLLLDRFLGAHFFDTRASGDAVLWQHFFWLFGHPEVYILMIPGFACVTEMVPVFSRKPIFGRAAMIGASVSIGLISLGVWAHHMFTVGMPSKANIFFTIATLLVGVPTGIKIFNWMATMWGGRIRFTTPMLFCVAFLFQFLIAGLTGIMLGVAPFDWQLGDSYFVVAHFHYTLIGGLLMTLFAAIYYWFPKATGRMLDETLGKWHFWLLIIGFHITFDPLHFAGLLGMPRRIYTYPTGRGWDGFNWYATWGVAVQAAGILIFVINVLYSLFKGKMAGNDPWDAWTLEWATTSPPPEYNFAVTPVVHSSRPLWDLKHPEDPDWKYEQA
ncbi:MAG TPA: cytochrome c oxidase subunit I, partial [Bryobacteraceae bacterium]|nr:cytochrome c oxidase subunit I [Bryobacteraceae bacterium]